MAVVCLRLHVLRDTCVCAYGLLVEGRVCRTALRTSVTHTCDLLQTPNRRRCM